MPGRLPRHVLPGHLHELTFRCYQSRLLLRPDEKLNKLFKGCLAKAQQATGLEVVWIVAMSNHAHCLARPESHTQLAEFLCHFKTNLSKEVGRLRTFPGGIFAGVRTDVAPVTDEEEAQVGRLIYLLSQGVKEGLCPTPWSWPGVQCASAIRAGKLTLEGGVWIDRSAMFHDTKQWRRAKNRKRRRAKANDPRFKPREKHYEEQVSVHLSKLPCWQHLSDADYCRAVRDLMKSVIQNYQEQIQRLSKNWRRNILIKVPTSRPGSTKSGPRVLVHAASKSERHAFRERLHTWLDQYWRASERLREGALDAIKNFPPNCFPPALPPQVIERN